MMEPLTAEDIADRLRSQRSLDTATLHRLRREFSRRLAEREPKTVIAVAHRLLDMPGVPGARMIACALVGNHPKALAAIDSAGLERLGRGMTNWGDVDVFGCLVAGLAWRTGSIGEQVVHRWARSGDRWWRRAALVSTVPLNVRSQGGRGDARRTLRVCRLLLDDRDDMVVKALSWALRALSIHEPTAVAKFVDTNEAKLARRVVREVRNKLEKGLKNPPAKR